MAISNVELIPGSWVVPDLPSVALENLDSIQISALFHTPEMGVFDWLGSPRPEVGAIINLRGRENVFHAGLNWHFDLFEGPLFLEAGLGMAIHDGVYENAAPPMRNLGCNPLFHWSAAVGSEITENVNLVVKWAHVSHAGICGVNNMGINHIGATLGFKF